MECCWANKIYKYFDSILMKVKGEKNFNYVSPFFIIYLSFQILSVNKQQKKRKKFKERKKKYCNKSCIVREIHYLWKEEIEIFIFVPKGSTLYMWRIPWRTKIVLKLLENYRIFLTGTFMERIIWSTSVQNSGECITP